jgi:hypothetical protein
VPLKYPTALIYVDESAVKASAGRFFACNDGVQLADLVSGAVAHQRGQGNRTASPTSHKGKAAARLAAAFGLNSFEDVRNDRVNVATLDE